MNNDEIKIRQLLKKFMDGTTTVDEEQEIARWFRHHPKVSDDLEDYRTMFSWFDDGMPLDKDNKSVILSDEGNKGEATNSNHRWIWTAIAIAASAALLIGFFMTNGGQQEQPEQEIAVRTVLNDSAKVKARVIKEDNETQKDTINSNINNNDVKANDGRHRRSRVRFEPMSPRPLYTQADTLMAAPANIEEPVMAKTDDDENVKTDVDGTKLLDDNTANKIIDNMLATIEENQQIQLKLLNLLNKVQEQSIMATLDDEDVY